MLKPRFAVNVYAIGGLVFLVVGAGLVVTSQTVPLTSFVTLPMGAGFAAIGVLWTVLAGRRGRLKAPRGLAQSGQRTMARLADVQATGSVSRSGEYGPITSQVFRLDLELVHPARGPVTVRVFRSLRGPQVLSAVRGSEVPVAVDPTNPRRIAILWDQVALQPRDLAVAQQVMHAMGHQFPAGPGFGG